MGPLLAVATRYGRWLALPLGVLEACAFAPFSLHWLAPLCTAALFLVWQDADAREAALRGFLFTAGTFLAGTYWIYHSVHLIGQAPVWIALFLMLGLVSIMGAYAALLGYVAGRFVPVRGLLRWLLALPGGLVIMEWVRGWFLSGFPWLSLGYSQLATPLRGFAPLLGVYGVSLAVAVTAGALTALALGERRERWIALGVAVGVWATGAAAARTEWTQPTGREVSVALVQGAVPQSMKWQPGQLERTMALYAGMTRPYLGTSIIVWPESAIPTLESDIRGYLDGERAAAAARGSSLVMGLVRRDPASGDYYNGIAAWGPAEQWYYKRRLVPFGEFFPVPARVREWMRLMNLPYSDFASGPAEQAPLEAGGERLAPTVCYEDAYGAEQVGLAARSTLLVNVSNDAWFGDSTAPHQHLDISRMRSLETGRPMLRATNDGVTALIRYDGSLAASLPQFRPGVLTGVVRPRTGATPYVRLGNVPVLALAWLGLLAALSRRGRTA
ncbi:MAG TPA: apolipoprotein N-acyltransferase [Steroidobacteraceae bacterium]|nr:apolipoprotein N-acyltransferase [Steroidobacteraceae bacterium]